VRNWTPIQIIIIILLDRVVRKNDLNLEILVE
jgi:hypothetical protein